MVYPGNNPGDINPHLHLAWRISGAIDQAISIDNYVDSQEDPQLSLVAKLSIAESILEAEKQSLLKVERTKAGRETLNFGVISETWYHHFFQILTEGLRLSELEKLFENVSIISFNYDRTLEHYLFHAIKNYYEVQDEKIKEILGELTIIHPYGTVGKLPWEQGDRMSVQFGTPEQNLLNVAAGIQTFTEQVSDEDSMANMHRVISESDQLCFLGFAFHDANMQLLDPSTTLNAVRILATAYEISESDCVVIQDKILTMGWEYMSEYLENRENIDIQVRRDLTCTKFFKEYSRLLRS